MLLLCGILFLLNALLSYNQAKHEEIVDEHGMVDVLKAYEADPISWEKEYKELQKHHENFMAQKMEEYTEFLKENPGATDYTWEPDDTEKNMASIHQLRSGCPVLMPTPKR